MSVTVSFSTFVLVLNVRERQLCVCVGGVLRLSKAGRYSWPIDSLRRFALLAPSFLSRVGGRVVVINRPSFLPSSHQSNVYRVQGTIRFLRDKE